MLAVVVSRADEASERIGERLLDRAAWTETTDDGRPDGEGGGTVYRTDGAVLREFDELHLDLSRAADAFDDPDLLVFASRHAGETGPLLTAHHTGNFGAADFGGDPGSFARACPRAHREVVTALAEYAPDGYEVGMECTHHGPTAVGAPSMFVEVGSGEAQWRDPAAADAAARAILSLREVAPDAVEGDGTARHLVGLGGGHYAPRFERVVRETDWAVGHVAADWSLDALEEWADDEADREAVLDRAFAASAAEFALLDADRPELEATVESLGYRVVDETFVRTTSGVPLSLVAELESAVGSVGEGLRFGDAATGGVEGWAVTDVPDDLLAEARGVDADAVRSWVETEAVAFGTEQNGTVVAGPIVVSGGGSRGDVVVALADALRSRYESVEREGDELVARETAFDPGLAREAGVPEGPAFGRLSSGEAVEVDGERIEPESVRSERIRRFTL